MINTDDFNELKKLPIQRSELNYSRVFNQSEFVTLSKGLEAQDMDSKWNVVMHDNCLYLYRSWTGSCIYSVSLQKDGNEYRAKETFVNRNPDEYKSDDDDYDVQLLDFFISNLILGESKPFPNKETGNEPDGVLQHSMSGTGYKEIKVSEIKPWWKFW